MKELINEITNFRDERGWNQKHHIKDLLLGLNIEVGELQELFLWSTQDEEIDGQALKHELADIFIFLIYISDKYKIDLESAILEKIEIHKNKYPICKLK